MSQFDFGTIDPYVVDGVQLAGMLNQWRDAIHSWHRGATRPSYVVPGTMWINDAGGATNWIVNVYMGATPGDVALFIYNTTTGSISVAPGSGGFTANIIAAQGLTPTFAWNKTDNAIDAKRWQAVVNAGGALVLSSLTDAGAVQQSFTFNRDGTVVAPSLWRVLSTVANAAGLTGIDFPPAVIPADINNLKVVWGDIIPVTNDVDFIVQFYNSVGTLDTGANYTFANTAANHAAAANATVTSQGSSAAGYNTAMALTYSATSAKMANTAGGGGRGYFEVPRIKGATRKALMGQHYYLNAGATLVASSIFADRATNGAITGLRMAMSSGNIAGGSAEMWGSP